MTSSAEESADWGSSISLRALPSSRRFSSRAAATRVSRIAPTVEGTFVILHLVTDRHRLAGEVSWERARECLIAQARYAVEAGVDVLQIRERDLEARELARLCADFLQAARG